MRRAVVTVVALVALSACHRTPAGGGAFRPMEVGDTAPAYAMADLNGDTVRIAPGGPVTLVNVWATWCTSCAEEMSDLARMDSSYRNRGLRVIGISVDESSDLAVERFVADHHLSFTVLHDPSNVVQDRYSVMAVPTTYLIDSTGRVLWEHAGNIAGVMEGLRAAADSALTPQDGRERRKEGEREGGS